MSWFLSMALAAPASLSFESEPVLVDRRVEELPEDGIVGGQVVTHGGWEDVAAIVFDNSWVGCTGTLVAPDLVLTAAHCADGITDVILDSTDYATNQGESLSVSRIWVHPSYDGWRGYDIALLRLSRASTRTPRVIATDCVRDTWLVDDADVAAVGYGATDIRGTQYGSKLREGFMTIDDADCGAATADGVFMGCAPDINPGGEIGAGGGGVDACFGDSGGPLYLLTPDGQAYLTGVTSRSYAGIDPNYPCRDGGIWVRADAVMDWIEDVSGETLERPDCTVEPPEVDVAPVVVVAGEDARIDVTVDDGGAGWTAEMVEPPAHGRVVVGAGGVTFEADAGYDGPDAFVVDIARRTSAWGEPAATRVEVGVTILPPGSDPASVGGSPEEGGGHDEVPEALAETVTYRRVGCDVGGGSFGWLGVGVILGGVRRRRGLAHRSRASINHRRTAGSSVSPMARW